jgi:uncharacterized protein YlaI
MRDEVLEIPNKEDLNLEHRENKPTCPVCETYLEEPDRDYEYKRLNPDTRWFWCPQCEGHLGYHRMKKRWKVDPYDLDESPAFREFFGMDE